MIEDRDARAEHERLLGWADVLDVSTYYEILGLLDIADDTAIKQAFHRFALAFHPDRHLEAPDDVRKAVRSVFKRGAEGYRVLSNPGLRAKYDLSVARGILRMDAGELPKSAMVNALKSLEDLCRSPAARLSASRADAYLGAGDFTAARRELKMALSHDRNDNPEIEDRLDAIDLAMFAMGD